MSTENTDIVEVIQPGLFSTIQDVGRKKYRASGVPLSGVMDQYSYSIANKLVGNKTGEAVIEATFIAPTLRFHCTSCLAITGAKVQAFVNKQQVGSWRCLTINKGDVLSFGSVESGSRIYIAFGGGIQVEQIMGSRSVYQKAAIGPCKGSTIKTGDKLPILSKKKRIFPPRIKGEDIPTWNNRIVARVMKGVHFDEFDTVAIDLFLTSLYTIDNNSDRMGYRLNGSKLIPKNGADVISLGIVKGAIQVTGDHQPIIMMADAQTTGGYTQIANIITADLHKIAQLKAGDKIEFQFVSNQEAIDALEKQAKNAKQIISRWR